MSHTATETKHILNDLVLINNDRIAGYEKALEEIKSANHSGTDNSDLITTFQAMIDQSREYRNALGREVEVLGGDMEDGTMTSGKLYRAWMDVKTLFSGKSRHSILAACEGGEDAAQKAYTEALHDEDLPNFLRELILTQQDELGESHDAIKALRDQAE